jgi:hypothetical protein
MVYTIKTSPYNERRYGKPWLARVKTSLTKDFEFIDWQGQQGQAGEFVFEALPGEMVAEGQKDHRKGRGGVDECRILLPNGNNVETSKLDLPDSRLLRMDPTSRWVYAAKERLRFWLGTTDPRKSADRWRLVREYSLVLGIPNPLMAQAAQDLGLITPTSEPAVTISADAFF